MTRVGGCSANHVTPLVAALLLAGCGRSSSAAKLRAAPDAGDAPDAGTAADAATAGFRACRGRAFAPAPAQGWRHHRSHLIVHSGAPNHSAQDVLAHPGEAPMIVGKLSYGLASKDLEGELVRVFLDECDGWHPLGDRATDGDGRIAVAAPADLAAGVYEARLQVLGDGSSTSSFLWVLPAGTRLVISDVDGTLTASDRELFEQIFDGKHVPVPYPGAVELMRAHADKHWLPLYLTGRPYWLTPQTRAWLADLHLAPGPLHVTDSNQEALPTTEGVGAFKKAYLERLLAAGYQIDFAYGNATTDVFAYEGVGIPASLVWIIGKNGGQRGTHAVAAGWQARVDEVRALEPVKQPF